MFVLCLQEASCRLLFEEGKIPTLVPLFSFFFFLLLLSANLELFGGLKVVASFSHLSPDLFHFFLLLLLLHMSAKNLFYCVFLGVGVVQVGHLYRIHG